MFIYHFSSISLHCCAVFISSQNEFGRNMYLLVLHLLISTRQVLNFFILVSFPVETCAPNNSSKNGGNVEPWDVSAPATPDIGKCELTKDVSLEPCQPKHGNASAMETQQFTYYSQPCHSKKKTCRRSLSLDVINPKKEVSYQATCLNVDVNSVLKASVLLTSGTCWLPSESSHPSNSGSEEIQKY